jgi:hypothetical protein
VYNKGEQREQSGRSVEITRRQLLFTVTKCNETLLGYGKAYDDGLSKEKECKQMCGMERKEMNVRKG